MPEQQTLQPVKLQDDSGKAIAVRSLAADAVVDGPMGRTTLRITFNNDSDKVIEGDLVFPLPSFGALKTLDVKVGTRDIKGQFKPRERAQAEYKKAVKAGHTAILGESEGEDFGRLRVAPIDKGEDVEVTVTIESPLQPVTNGLRLIIPTTYMPRFVEDPDKLKEVEKAAVERPRPMTLAARATVSVRILGAGEARCLSHQAVEALLRDEGSEILIKDIPLDRDVQVEIMDRPEGQDPKVWARYDASQGPDGKGPTTAVAVTAPRFADEGPTIPREVVILIDRSGSMTGTPIAAAIRAAKGCLRALGPQDRFNLVAFDDGQSALANASLPFDDKNLAAGDAFADSIRVQGGTELSGAMRVVLQGKAVADTQVKDAPRPSIEHTLRVVILLTDGDVGSAQKVIEESRADMHDTRVFVVGIGESVNHALLAALAEAGRGTYTPVGIGEDIEEAVAKIKSAIDAPLLTGIKVRIEEGDDVRDASGVESLGALDLFAGRPLLFAFRGEVKPGATLILAGQRPGGVDYKVRVPVSLGVAEDASIAASMWAILKNRRLTYLFDSKNNAALEELGTTFGVVNSQVALVGVHVDQRNLTADPETIPVVLPMPRNIAEADEDDGSRGMTRGVTRSASLLGGVPKGVPGAYQAVSFSAGGQSRGVSLSSVRSRGGPALECAVRGGDDDDGTLGTDLSRSAGDISATVKVSDSMLRALMLQQGADGLFGGSYAQTLAVVAALAMRGHTARSGDFRAEMRRTAQTLASRIPSLSGSDLVLAATALAILRVLDGGAIDLTALPKEVASQVAALSPSDPQALKGAIRAALGPLKGHLSGAAGAVYTSFVQQ